MTGILAYLYQAIRQTLWWTRQIRVQEKNAREKLWTDINPGARTLESRIPGTENPDRATGAIFLVPDSPNQRQSGRKAYRRQVKIARSSMLQPTF
jgi:hypothetical protein